MIASHAAQTVRGVVILVAWLLAPLVLGLLMPTTIPGFFALLVWQSFVFPYGSIYDRSTFTPAHPHLAWAPSTALVVACLQWLFVAGTFGWLTRNRRWLLQVGLAPLAIFITALIVQRILQGLGYVVYQAIPR